MTTTLTHKDIARALDIAEATVKSYRRSYPEFFELVHQGKPLRYAPSALEVCRAIRDGRRESLTEADIRQRLREITPVLGEADADTHGELGGVRRHDSVETVPALSAEFLGRYESALAQIAEVQRQLVQMHEESAARMEQMQRRMADALALLQDHTGQQSTMIDALARRQSEVLDALSTVHARVARKETTMPAGRLPQDKEVGASGSESHNRITRVAVRNAYGDVQRYTLATGDSDTPIPEMGPQADASAAIDVLESRPQGERPDSFEDAVASAPADTPEHAEEQATHRPEVFEGEEMSEEPALIAENGEASADSMALSEAAEEFSQPPHSYRELPLVVRSEMGEYLGVGGKNLGAFSLDDLSALVDQTFASPAHTPFEVRYVPASAADGATGPLWTLYLDQKPGQSYRLELERTTTPRGNDVVVLSALYVDGQDVPPANLYLFIKQMLQLAGE